MTEAEAWYVLDSNILLRLGIQHHGDFRQIRSAIDELQRRDNNARVYVAKLNRILECGYPAG